MASGKAGVATAEPSAAPCPAPVATDQADSPQLPPEKPSEQRRRTYIILSFWVLVVLLGLPIWWKTTSIYRAELPLTEMMEWADGKACKPVFPLQVTLQAGSLQEQEAQTLLRQTQHALDDLNDFTAHHLRLQLAPHSAKGGEVAEVDSQSAVTIRLVPGQTAISSSLDPTRPILDVTYPPNSIPSHSSSSTPGALASYIATELRATFAEEQAILSYLLSSSSPSSEPRTKSLSPELLDTIEKRTTRALKYSHTYHLTFSLFTAGASPSTWDIDTALNDYVKPVLDVLNPIHDFTIDTQVQLYATPGVQSEVLSKDDLVSFINAAEWPLSPSIGGAPTVNFIIYIGNQTVRLDPETDATSQSWLVPQWGSVYLLSLPPTTTHIDASTLKQPLLTFSSHLLSLLGTPESGSLPLRLSTLARIRSADLLLRASSTLGSLARLSLALPYIAIPRSVADGVSKTLYRLDLACANLASPAALEHARIAESEAERAFFEKSMVGQLYFPDEHKVAVYLPLLGPVGVPLIMGLLTEVKQWIKRRKERAEAAKRKEE
ncbi:hypothetical protein jhhlp_004735 [Lomentospora prolificans]|uniref:GPI transamidase component PIG-S n=1 Tax=Lomentospora prolificans TaxID=41688 RepID=A0A2N3N8J3_9PEZI|nr:hypothetical protein jhhlp_004735 [Lomentospora prolificans]